MKKQTLFLLLVLVLCCQGQAFSTVLSDSIGVTVRDGQKHIVHEVEAGETLFALSRRYGVDIESIREVNGESINSLTVGQNVMIPLLIVKTANEGNIHTVGPSETLYSISRQYNVQVDDIKTWNNLNENSISIGQKLLINEEADNNALSEKSIETESRKTHKVQQSQTLYSISRMYDVTTDQIKEWNQLSSNSLDIGQVLIVSVAGSATIDNDNSSMLPKQSGEPLQIDGGESREVLDVGGAVAATNVIPDLPEDNSKDEMDDDTLEKPADKIVEKGLAEVIASTSDTKKYLALHRQAPIGTIMQVKNEMNGQSVFVRIVGSIQDTGDNSKVMLMISKKAFDRLGAIDRRFPVQVSYIP